jgi:hypothetical protein
MAEFYATNRRKPDRMQWLIVILMGMIASGIGFQIVDNQENAVSRSLVLELVEHDKDRIQPWQLQQINQQLEDVKKKQDVMSNAIEEKIPDVTIRMPRR